MDDMNAVINPSAKPFTKSAKHILNWEGTGEIRIRTHTHPIHKAPQKELLRHDHDNSGTG